MFDDFDHCFLSLYHLLSKVQQEALFLTVSKQLTSEVAWKHHTGDVYSIDGQTIYLYTTDWRFNMGWAYIKSVPWEI